MIYGTRDWIDEQTTTKNINEAIFIMSAGTLIDGEFDCGSRGLDHNTILGLAPDELSHGDKWDWVHENMGVVRLVPETHQALIGLTQELTEPQKNWLNGTSYEIARY